MRLIVENRPHSRYGKYGVFFLAMLASIQICWADSAYFECTYSSKASKDGVKKDSLQARFILDLGRKKAYVTRSGQNFEIQYYMDVKDTLITFVEVTPEKKVRVATIDGGRGTVYSMDESQFYGFCLVK